MSKTRTLKKFHHTVFYWIVSSTCSHVNFYYISKWTKFLVCSFKFLLVFLIFYYVVSVIMPLGLYHYKTSMCYINDMYRERNSRYWALLRRAAPTRTLQVARPPIARLFALWENFEIIIILVIKTFAKLLIDNWHIWKHIKNSTKSNRQGGGHAKVLTEIEFWHFL